MSSHHKLSDFFDEDFEANSTDIHVILASIVERPPKRQKATKTDMASLMKLAEWRCATIPPVQQLKLLLAKPLPFKPSLRLPPQLDHISESDTPPCDSLRMEIMMDAYLLSCENQPLSSASESKWQRYYDMLLEIPVKMCEGSGFVLETQEKCHRSHRIHQADVAPRQHPSSQQHCLPSGEEKKSLTNIQEPREELTSKMRQWNVVLYSELPYILGYATAGPRLDIVAIEPARTLRCTSILSLDIIMDKETTLKVFVNMGILLAEMIRLTPQPYEGILEPFKTHVNERRSIELLDNVVERRVTTAQCESASDFSRLVNVYKTLRMLNEQVKIPYLQAVVSLQSDAKRLVVQLAPLGYARLPKASEIRHWLQHLLTALKIWHDSGYCHGDRRLRNILYVPSAGACRDLDGHWMLIDMDESHIPNARAITWIHQCPGQQLRFQHDLFQLGCLMSSLSELTPSLKEMQKYLKEALHQPDVTATRALGFLEHLTAADTVTCMEVPSDQVGSITDD